MNIANLLFQCGIVITTLGYRIRIFFILTPATTSLALALGRKKCTNTGFQVDGVQQQQLARAGAAVSSSSSIGESSSTTTSRQAGREAPHRPQCTPAS